MWKEFLVGLILVGLTRCLDNGLARTPPMGWLTWERFECSLDCEEDPDNCIGERLIMLMADAVAKDGYKDVGYEYVAIDDCWPADTRDAQGRLQPDPRRFPSGMKALADYVHSRGLKFGLYEDVGRHTCAGAPGTLGHYQLDAQTFADWGVDMIKFDGCNTDEQHYEYGYPAMGRFLNQTGRPIMYSCEWPLYARALGYKPDYQKVADTCNTFRVYGDIMDSYQSITSIVNWYGDDPGNFSEVAGPGNFCDADMVVVGNYGMSPGQERVQFGMWAIFASPLLMSVDLRHIRPESKALLQNRRVLSINQDPLGKPGKRVLKLLDNQLQVYTRPVVPAGSFALAVYYQKQSGFPVKFSTRLRDIGLTHPAGYNVSEVFEGHHLGVLKPGQNFTCRVNPSGIYLVRATVLGAEQQKAFQATPRDNSLH